MTDILFPVGRMVGGSLYKSYPRMDNAGKPKLDKEGKPETAYSFGFAIAKQGEQHWSQTAWGQMIHKEGTDAYGAQTQHPTFAWKIVDGDSQIPNKKGKRPCDQEAYPGHWILWFSQSWQPRVCNADGTVTLAEVDAVIPGYFIQVFASVVANGTLAKPAQTPGVYLNPVAVALAAYGERIITNDVDTSTVGFGGGALPPGASLTPVGSFASPAANGPGIPHNMQGGPGMMPPAQQPYTPQVQPYTPPVTQAYAPPVQPNPAILQPTPPVQMPPARVMLPAANGATYEQMLAAGWNDALMIQHGMMQA